VQEHPQTGSQAGARGEVRVHPQAGAQAGVQERPPPRVPAGRKFQTLGKYESINIVLLS